MSACRGWGGGVNWAKLGEWGGLLGDRGAERVGQGVPERSAPNDGDVDRFEDRPHGGTRP
eukprot:1135888-Prymnesium_polylepis.1